MQWVPMFFPVV